MIEIKIASAALPAPGTGGPRAADCFIYYLQLMAGIIPVYSVTADWLTETTRRIIEPIINKNPKKKQRVHYLK